MSKEVLSLKGLYQFIFVKDYPTFSNGIISKNKKVGLTLTKFWQENLLIDFRNLKYGRMIWRTEGGRNRYISEFCNRSERISFYDAYINEWGNMVNQDVMLRQISQFSRFLVDRDYDYDVFVQKLGAYIKMLGEMDDEFTREAENYFKEALADRKYLEEFGARGQAFFCGWVLTLLMLHAMAGNGEGESALRQFRKSQEISLRELAKMFVKAQKPGKREVKFLTTKNSEICREALDGRHFFGREEELFELLDMLKVGGKYLISGIGGIGKTELMRQLLHSTIEEGLADCICIIQYEGSMADSLIRAFGCTHNGEKEIKLQEALAVVHMHADEKILIFVDNVSHSMEEDNDIEQLLKLPATVFMTSRYKKMKGFESYPVKPISKNAGALIFRDNYALPINNTDKKLLDNLLEKDIWRHTLTLRLLGKAARAKNWSLQELLKQLDADGKAFGLDKQNGYENLRQLYRQIYNLSGVEAHMNRFLQMFALLPYRSYSMDFIHNFLRDFLGEESNVQESVEQLWESGWLEKGENGYSMHPFVSECILVKEVPMEEVYPFFDRVMESMNSGSETPFVDAVSRMELTDSIQDLSQEEKNYLMILGKVAQRTVGVPKETYIQIVLAGYFLEVVNVGAQSVGKQIEELWSHADQYSEFHKVCIFIALLNSNYSNYDEMELQYEKILQMNIPELLRDLCKLTLGSRILGGANLDFQWRVAKDNWDEKNSIAVRSNGAYMLAMIYGLQGNIDGIVSSLQEGLELWKDNACDNNETRKRLRLNLAHVYSMLGKHAEAEQSLKEWDETIETSIYMKFSLLMIKGIALRDRGAQGFGVKELEEAMKLAEILYVNYIPSELGAAASELALAYHRTKRYEEAIHLYLRAYKYVEEFDNSEMLRHRVLNNLGVLYLECDRLEEAQEQFIQAYEMGKELGGLAQAEPANNLSKVWGKLGDKDKELQYIEEALPIMEHFYGSEHPKVVDAKKRREEITGK